METMNTESIAIITTAINAGIIIYQLYKKGILRKKEQSNTKVSSNTRVFKRGVITKKITASSGYEIIEAVEIYFFSILIYSKQCSNKSF